MTEARRRLVLHMGLSKTGTTTIQSFCRANAALLKRQGVVYPSSSAAVPDHPAFRATLLRPGASRQVNHSALAGEIRLSKGVAGPVTGALPLWRAACEEFNQSRANTVLVSYENFYLNVDRYDFASVRRLFEDIELWAIIYLRRPEDWAPSLYGQGIRGKGRRAGPFDRFARSITPNLAYSSLLDAIGETIACSRLVVGNFDEARKVGLVEDFCQKAELALADVVPDAATTRNSSPPWWVVLFLLQCNRAKLSDGVFMEVRKALNRLAKEGDVAVRPGLHVATPGELEALRAITAEDADRLARLYGVRFHGERRAAVAHRPFDEEDLLTIRAAIRGSLSDDAVRAVEDLTCGV